MRSAAGKPERSDDMAALDYGGGDGGLRGLVNIDIRERPQFGAASEHVSRCA